MKLANHLIKDALMLVGFEAIKEDIAVFNCLKQYLMFDCILVFSISEGSDVNMENTNASPARYLLKIESFSSLSDNGIIKYESNEFKSGGYSWKMIIHPDGNEDGQGHISAYLAIVATTSLQADWEVNASFSFLIFDQIHDNYNLLRGMERRFRNIQTEWGFSKCISHATFKDPSNGYLVSDKCIFGVDVYVIKNQGIGECLSSLNDIEPYKHEWKISEFTKLKNEVCSEEFTVGDCKWKLSLYPKGNIGQNGQNISVFLESVDAERFDCQKKVKAKFSISIKDRISGKHHKKSGLTLENVEKGKRMKGLRRHIDGNRNNTEIMALLLLRYIF
ncbi:uncharacterized protein LOC132643931 [Lycium barbarum]|uniref:uncharacterized protein LOC132643931 n=1 Tax=Lycium barbarum TaxID=112863 RepID=UPI00293EE2E9|nr:uncharacterized protein LOC132643931 [Lycium barbarum]